MKKCLTLLTLFIFNLYVVSVAQKNFIAGEVLPVESNSVSYNKWNPENKTLKIIEDNKGVAVLWKTVSTINASHFELQRAQGSENFVSIKQVQVNRAAGRSNYALAFRHSTVVEEKVTYRLKLVFDDGSVEFSDVLFVEKEGSKVANGYLMILR